MLINFDLQPKIVEKIVRKNSISYRVRAEFSYVEGKILGRIISIERVRAISEFPISSFRSSKKPLCLGGVVGQEESNFPCDFGEETISPYFSLDFFVSQMTRAPSELVLSY